MGTEINGGNNDPYHVKIYGSVQHFKSLFPIATTNPIENQKGKIYIHIFRGGGVSISMQCYIIEFLKLLYLSPYPPTPPLTYIHMPQHCFGLLVFIIFICWWVGSFFKKLRGGGYLNFQVATMTATGYSSSWSQLSPLFLIYFSYHLVCETGLH